MRFRTLLELGRVSNLPTVWSNLATGWLLGGGTPISGGFAWTAVGCSLLYASGMAMNDACDARWDRKHKGDRPIVKGEISLTSVWLLTAIYGIGGVLAVIIGGGGCPILVCGLVVSIASYNVFHKFWSGSTWLMGSCRFFLYIIAASSASGGGSPSPESMVWGAILGLYVVGLTFVARGESTGAPMLRWPLAFLFAPVICGLVHLILGWPWWTVFFIVGFFLWVGRCLAILRGSEGEGRVGRAVGMLLAGMVIIDALALSSGWPYLSIAFCGAAPILILFQRLIAAT